MIDQSVFKAEWKVLCQRFNRDPGTAVAARYYQSLSPRMTTEEFKVASRAVFDSSEFFPSPDQIADAIQPSLEEEAMDQWTLCLQVMRGGHHALDRMTPAGQRVVQMLGGPRRLGQTLEKDNKWVRKEFLGFYREVAHGEQRRNRMLPPGGSRNGDTLGEVTRLMLDSGFGRFPDGES